MCPYFEDTIKEKSMKVAVLGFGTVGYGVFEMLKNAEGLEPGSVLVRQGKDDADYKVTSISQITCDPEIWAVAEVMGGTDPAYEYVSAALRAGKHVVTSNKALVAAHGPELEKLAAENNVAFLFSAACGGAVPFLHNIALAVESDSILSLGGILNGTTNYMLDAMQSRFMTYADALADAQALGYAEADPTADVSGMDALRKIMLACAVAYNMLPDSGLCCEGIESITAEDVNHIQASGYTCRLVTSGGLSDDGKLYAYIEPVLFPANAPECSVLKNFNMAKYIGKNSGQIVFMGQGAGRWPTASAVLRDLNDILHGKRIMMRPDCKRVTADNSLCEHRYYVRLPENLCTALPTEKADVFDGIARVTTKAISVKAMHDFAEESRKGGSSVFFAAIGD